MRSRRIKKAVTVLLLAVSLVAVQTMQFTVKASTSTLDLSNPAITVSNYSDLKNAIDTASDGTVIGINTIIPVYSGDGRGVT